MGEIWKSPRKVEEEIRQYKHDRFERLMQDAGDDEEKRALGFAALRAEFAAADIIIGAENNERVRIGEE